MTASASATRILPCWIESFCDYTAGFQSPLILRRWAAISAVAAAMERKVWVRTLGSEVYPNLYVILVAPPGTGKGMALNPIESIYQKLDHLFLAPSSVTAPALIDCLAEAKRRVIRLASIPPYLEFHSVYAISSELSVLFPEYTTEMMSYLTDIYDCRQVPFKQRRRTKEVNIKIAAPQINLFGATTPAQLGNFLPEGAWNQGFMSRVIMIYASDIIRPTLFREPPDFSKSETNLTHDLKLISEVVGKMEWDEDAKIAMEHWHQLGGPPTPQHMKLTHYCSRRTVHLLKLCMVSSMARGSSLNITLDDFARAQNWLLEAEDLMPDIFKSMAIGAGDSDAIEETWQFVFKVYAREKKPILEHRLVAFLKERVPSASVMKVIEIMVRSKYMEMTPGEQGIMGYKPGEKTKQY